MKTPISRPQGSSFLLAVLVMIASAGGLLIEGLYQDSEAIKAVWFVNDLITLFVAVPLLFWALHLVSRESIRGKLLWVGSLWYLLYNYVFYAYGAQFNAFFLLYILIFVLSAVHLIGALVTIEPQRLFSKWPERLPEKHIARFLFFFATALGTPWVLLVLQALVVGEGLPFEMRVVIATDLSFLVSLLVVSARMLIQKKPWGLVLAAMVMYKGLLYPLVLILGGVRSLLLAGQWDPFIPLYAFLWLLCCGFYWRLMAILGGEKKGLGLGQ